MQRGQGGSYRVGVRGEPADCRHRGERQFVATGILHRFRRHAKALGEAWNRDRGLGQRVMYHRRPLIAELGQQLSGLDQRLLGGR